MNDGTFRINGKLLAWHIIGPSIIIWIVGTKIAMALGLPPTVIDIPSLMVYLTAVGIALIRKAEKE